MQRLSLTGSAACIDNASYVRYAAESESEVSKYELSDALVANVVSAAESGKVDAHLIAALISDLKPQIPIPTPTKLGAVVRTDRGVFLLADPGAELCWAQPISPSDSPDWFIDGGIGRITEVLSEGVDL